MSEMIAIPRARSLQESACVAYECSFTAHKPQKTNCPTHVSARGHKQCRHFQVVTDTTRRFTASPVQSTHSCDVDVRDGIWNANPLPARMEPAISSMICFQNKKEIVFTMCVSVRWCLGVCVCVNVMCGVWYACVHIFWIMNVVK